MEIGDIIAGCVLLGGTFLIFTVINFKILFMKIQRKEKIPSPAPLIGGAAGAFFVICFLGFDYPLLIIAPLIIDPGSIPLVVWFFICLVSDIRKKN